MAEEVGAHNRAGSSPGMATAGVIEVAECESVVVDIDGRLMRKRDGGPNQEGSCSMVHGPLIMVHGPWLVVHGPSSMVLGPWCIVHCSWSMVHGAWREAWSDSISASHPDAAG